jgi:hypothetical protein
MKPKASVFIFEVKIYKKNSQGLQNENQPPPENRTRIDSSERVETTVGVPFPKGESYGGGISTDIPLTPHTIPAQDSRVRSCESQSCRSDPTKPLTIAQLD